MALRSDLMALTSYELLEFDHVECCPAYWTTIGTLSPRCEALIVKNMVAGDDISNQFCRGTDCGRHRIIKSGVELLSLDVRIMRMGRLGIGDIETIDFTFDDAQVSQADDAGI